MDPIPVLADLVAADSVNPSLVPGAAGEGAAADVAHRAMIRAGLEVTRQAVQPGRPNVIGVLEGRTAGPTVMFCGHLDTVGVEGMTDPFVPRLHEGRLYGRGSQDMKGGVAAMIAAAGELASSWTTGRLVVAAVIDEEHGSLGAEALVREWTADFAVVTEPTDLAIAIGHKGFAWIEITVRGRAAHGSRPRDGRDAILHMGRVLQALEGLDAQLQATTPDPLQGAGSLHASLIVGGRELSSYPDQCVLQMERRTISGETDRSVMAEVNAILEALRAQDASFDASSRLVTCRSPWRIAADHRLVTTTAQALGSRGRSSSPLGMSFWTDAAILGDAGIPSILFGPGGAGLHSTEEYVNVDDVYTCRDVLADVARVLTRR